MGDEANLLPWAYQLLVVIYPFAIVMILLSERRHPTATMAWILALVFLPIAGLFAYFFFGRRKVRKSRRKRRRRLADPTEIARGVDRVESLPTGLPPIQRGLVRMALQSATAPLREAESIEVIADGRQAFDAMEAAIKSAQRNIYLEYYIWRDDEAGTRIRDLLIERAKAGIDVRLLYDDLGSLGTSSDHFEPLRAAGGHVRAFGALRLRIRLAQSRLNFRNHRKILSIDGNIAFTGGLNIGDEYRAPRDPELPVWRDLQVKISGDAVLCFDTIFLDDWLTTTGELLELQPSHPPQPATQTQPANDPHSELPTPKLGPLLQVLASGPDLSHASSIATQLAGTIGSATTRCWIATPYLVPDAGLQLILRTAALRGVDLRIMVPAAKHSDSRLVAAAARSYYDELMHAGCRIFEYQASMLHAKYLVVDDDVSIIGSANLDNRSLYINYEVATVFYDRNLSQNIAELFLFDQKNCKEIEIAERQSISTGQRLIENSARLLSPIL